MSDFELVGWIYGGLFIALGIIYRGVFVMLWEDVKRLGGKNG
jgi:hypothetical protein